MYLTKKKFTDAPTHSFSVNIIYMTLPYGYIDELDINYEEILKRMKRTILKEK